MKKEEERKKEERTAGPITRREQRYLLGFLLQAVPRQEPVDQTDQRLSEKFLQAVYAYCMGATAKREITWDYTGRFKPDYAGLNMRIQYQICLQRAYPPWMQMHPSEADAG